jgi:type IV secretory pathway VirD2 relaxase
MHDDEFTPRLGRMRGKAGESRYLSQVMKAAARAGKRVGAAGRRAGFNGSRIGRGASVARVLRFGDRFAGFRARRVIVKTRLVMLAGKGMSGARAHLGYIQRDGVTRDGAPGALYSEGRDIADGKAFLERADGDRHQFRFIVSAEDADQYPDLKPFVRRLMQQMEQDLGTTLDWVAVDHFNTGHPHTHVILRGKDGRGGDLVIARDYISHGLRARAADIVNLDLGPRTDLEIEERLRSDAGAERLTAIDRRLIRDMDDMCIVSARHSDPFQQALRAGRLQKLARMDLATHLGGDSWRLGADLATTLRRIGERGDIIRTMQRELSVRNLERAGADHVIYDPAAVGAQPIVGRVLSRGFADEHEDRHYLIVDGVDGRAHYAPLGKGAVVGAMPLDAIVRITPRAGGIRAADRTIADVAAAHGGRYTIDAHLRHDPSATETFAETHVRRLEAMRRVMRNLEREPDGAWIITPDHLEKVERFEARQLRDRPVSVETLSAVPLERLAVAEAATWLDRDLIAGSPVPVRDAGFGREVHAARELRRQWLIAEQLADEQDGRTVYRRNLLAALQRRELLRVGARLSEERGLPFTEAKTGDAVQGRLVRAVEMTSGRHALIERSRDFTLVPWRDVLERRVGKSVAGIVRESGISWTIGRQRSGPSIS